MESIFYKFDHRIQSLPPQVTLLLGEIDRIKGEFIVSPKMTPMLINKLRKSTLITSTGASTRIEGANLTDEQVEQVMRGLSLSKFSDRDTQEVQGYLETLQHVFEAHQDIPFKETTIVWLHQQLLKYSVKDELHRGHYKKKENTVGVLDAQGNIVRIMFETTPAYLTAKEMQELVEWTAWALERNRFHDLLIIANFAVEFLKIHPFEDGNGRLSRVLTNLLLLRSGYDFIQYVSHEQVIERRKEEYYLALRKSQETFGKGEETIAPWLNFFFSVLHEQASKAADYLKGTVEEILSPRQTQVWAYFSEVSEAGPSEIVQQTGVNLGTVRQALNRLVELGLLRRMGQGRGTRYVRV